MPKFVSKKDAEAQATEPQEETTPNYTRVLLGTYWDPLTGDWMWSRVNFDPLTMTVSEVITERVGGDREVMIDQLYIKQIQLNFFEKENVVMK